MITSVLLNFKYNDNFNSHFELVGKEAENTSRPAKYYD